jgi:hypothetical protein
MPSYAQMTELRNNCTWTWTAVNGSSGYKVVGPNGNSIFLPARGDAYYSKVYYNNERGFYWTRSLMTGNAQYAYNLSFTAEKYSSDWTYRLRGYSIRPVREQ